MNVLVLLLVIFIIVLIDFVAIALCVGNKRYDDDMSDEQLKNRENEN